MNVQQGQRSVVDVIVDGLRLDILEGRLVSGQRLVEGDITSSYQVSRGPVRVALSRLATEGLVEIQPHRGARVRSYGADEFLMIADTREVLEGLAARYAARAAPADALLRSELVRLNSDMAVAVQAEQVAIYMAHNREFHDRILTAARNPILERMLRQLQMQALRTLMQSRMTMDQLRMSHAQHGRLLHLILAGDEDGAETEMRLHIRAARDNLVEAAPTRQRRAINS